MIRPIDQTKPNAVIYLFVSAHLWTTFEYQMDQFPMCYATIGIVLYNPKKLLIVG